MTIRIFSDSIKIGDYTLGESSSGINFSGKIGGKDVFGFNQGGTFQGTVAGYFAGGQIGTPGGTPPIGYIDVIQSFPFATDTGTSDVGDLTQARRGAMGQTSVEYGYVSGGGDNLLPSINPGTTLNTIDKFPFASSANATDVGDISRVVQGVAGQSSTVSGYISGGTGTGPPDEAVHINNIDKFPFAINSNSSDVGDLTERNSSCVGQSSAVSGYTSSSSNNPPGFPSDPQSNNTISKFPFATDSNATDVGDLTLLTSRPAGQSSTESGYCSGGPANIPPFFVSNIIQKFPFASDANATDVGDLSAIRGDCEGVSSSGFGYTGGGRTTPVFAALDVIDKFPFASDASATDVGDLLDNTRGTAGVQD